MKNPGWECICKRLNRSCSSSLFSFSVWKTFLPPPPQCPEGILGGVAATGACTDCSKQHQGRLFSVTLGKQNKTNPLYSSASCAQRGENPESWWKLAFQEKLGNGVCALSSAPGASGLCAATKASLSFCCLCFIFGFFAGRNFFFEDLFLVSRTILWNLSGCGPNSHLGEEVGLDFFWMLLCPPSLSHGWWDELLSLLTEFQCWSPNISCARDLIQSLGPPCWMSRMGGFSLGFWGKFSLQFWGNFPWFWRDFPCGFLGEFSLGFGGIFSAVLREFSQWF